MPSILTKEHPLTNDLQWYIDNRPELYAYVCNVRSINAKFKIFEAPVKSGKRKGVECYSMMSPKDELNIYLTALHRVANKKQFSELQSYGITVYSINNEKKKDLCIHFVNKYITENKTITIHLDELDYGSGQQQLLGYIWNEFKNNPKVQFILYSATPEVAEAEYLQRHIDLKPVSCGRFIPPYTYYGIGKFLQNGQFHEATRFIKGDDEYINTDSEDDDDDNEEDDDEDIQFTAQGKLLIQKLIDATKDKRDERHIAVLRLAGSITIKGEKALQFDYMKENQQYIEKKYNIRLKFGGSNDNNIGWDEEDEWDDLSTNRSFIIVINQTSGRSTEWKCHHKLVWFHTYRTPDTPTSTIIQDQERPVYYITNYKSQPHIHIYGDRSCAEYSAGLITSREYNTASQRKLDSRLAVNMKKKHIEVERPIYCNSWNELKRVQLKDDNGNPILDNNGNPVIENFTKGRSLSKYISEDLKLKKIMNASKNTQTTLSDSIWQKWEHLEGFYMTNVRSSRTKFLTGKKARPIWFDDDIAVEMHEGLSEQYKTRINVIYDRGETDPEKYKFIVRRWKKTNESIDNNTSMYNIK